MEYQKKNLTDTQKEELLANIEVQNRTTKVGVARSRKVYQLFSEKNAETLAL